MGEIFSIGGGRITTEESTEMLQKLVDISDKDQPRVCFLPTAKDDYKNYVDSFHRKFGNKLGCKTTDISLIKENPSESQIRRKINKADIVYVSGGNTQRMLKVWQDKGVDKLLKENYQQDTILSGWSAGAICWFEKGHSDSDSYENDEWSYKVLNGLNLVNGFMACPHYDKIERQASFHTMMRESGCQKGLGIEDHAAVHIKDNKLRVHTSEGNVKLVKKKSNDQVHEKDITHLDHFISIRDL